FFLSWHQLQTFVRRPERKYSSSSNRARCCVPARTIPLVQPTANTLDFGSLTEQIRVVFPLGNRFPRDLACAQDRTALGPCLRRDRRRAGVPPIVEPFRAACACDR